MKIESIQTVTPAAASSPARLLDDRRRALLAMMLERNGIASEPSSIAKRRAPNSWPVSFAQRRLWFLDQMDPHSSAYNLRAAFRFRGDLDTDALSEAVGRIWARHDALRATFYCRDGAVAQRLLPAEWQGLRRVDDPAGDWTIKRAIEYVNDDSQLPFDLETGPLFRPLLIRAGASDHILALTFHHIVMDAWSVAIFMRELSTLYQAAHSGFPSELQPLRIQYADFAAWQQEWLNRPEARVQAEYWKRTLEGVPALELPFDRPRPLRQTTAGGDYSFPLGPDLTRAIHTFAREHNVTDFVVLMAAFQTALYRYSGQTDFAVGSTIAGRTRVETEPLIGLFISVLPLRSSIKPDASFRETVARVHESVLEWHQNQDLPFERVVEELRMPRDLSRHPVFQTLLTLHNAPLEPVRFSDVEISTVPLLNAVARFDLGVDITETYGQFELRFEYNADLFDHATIERFASSYRRLLEAGIAPGELQVSRLPLVSESERQRYIWLAGNPLRNPWQGLAVHELFELQVSRTGERIAASSGADQLSYRELDECATAFAEQLCAAGAGPGVLVGIAMPRCVGMLVALLGVLKSGAAYVPLDPDFPFSRLEFIISDSNIAILISEKETIAQIPPFAGKILLLDGLHRLRGAKPVRSTASSDSAPAYVIYTSGSTGRPKGVMIPHSAITNFLFSMSREPGIRQGDVLLATTTLSFDIAVLELFLPLVTGARVVIASREVVIDPFLLAREVNEQGVTIMQATPATWRMLIESGAQWNPEVRAFCGGEALHRDLADEILARCSRLWNMYGPTETTVWSMVDEIRRDGQPIMLGAPVANTDIHILDAHMNPTPPGVIGEIVIGGAGLARGYLNNPELTQEKFVPHPFNQKPGARLYRTGDLARSRPGGKIEFLGRADAQVKVRGHRIEPGEVEAALLAHPSITAAIVDAREDVRQGKTLVAWVVVAGVKPAVSDLRSHIACTLPEYMIPSAFVFVDQLPLTPNGKVDRRGLITPSSPQANLEEAYVAPQNSCEEKIALIWEELLGLLRVGRNQNFFELGGHSLLLARVCARIRSEIDPDITMTDLFRYPTVSSLAERLTSGHTSTNLPLSKARSRADVRLESLRQIHTREQS